MLKNKIILITGGASGIGQIMARLMLERKAKVIIWDINQEKIDETVSKFSDKGDVFGFNVDVSNIEQIKETAKKVKQERLEQLRKLKKAILKSQKKIEDALWKDLHKSPEESYLTAEFNS